VILEISDVGILLIFIFAPFLDQKHEKLHFLPLKILHFLRTSSQNNPNLKNSYITLFFFYSICKTVDKNI